MTFVRYIFIQVAAYGIDIGVFLVFVYTGLLLPVPANILAKIAAGMFAFLTHRNFTFRLDKQDHNSKQVYRYILLLGLNVPLSSAVLGLILLSIDTPVIAKLLSDILIVLFTFWLSKTWVFVTDLDRNS